MISKYNQEHHREKRRNTTKGQTMIDSKMNEAGIIAQQKITRIHRD